MKEMCTLFMAPRGSEQFAFTFVLIAQKVSPGGEFDTAVMFPFISNVGASCESVIFEIGS